MQIYIHRRFCDASEKQEGYIRHLAKLAGYPSSFEAIKDYGLGMRSAVDLSTREASELIDWLMKKTGTKKSATSSPPEPTNIAPAKVQPVPGTLIGRTVRTSKLGEGIVQRMNGENLVIRFNKEPNRERTFLRSAIEVVG